MLGKVYREIIIIVASKECYPVQLFKLFFSQLKQMVRNIKLD